MYALSMQRQENGHACDDSHKPEWRLSIWTPAILSHMSIALCSGSIIIIYPHWLNYFKPHWTEADSLFSQLHEHVELNLMSLARTKLSTSKHISDDNSDSLRQGHPAC